jgi:hypothetical protein
MNQVGGGLALGVDQQFFVELLVGAQAGAHNLDIVLGALGIAQLQPRRRTIARPVLEPSDWARTPTL